jgi:hypothetical protein
MPLRQGELASFRSAGEGRLDDWCTHLTYAPIQDNTGADIEAFNMGQGFPCKYYEIMSDEEQDDLPSEPLRLELHLPADVYGIVTPRDAFRIDLRFGQSIPEPFVVRIEGDPNLKSSVLVATVERVERYEPVTSTSFRLY